MCRAARGEGGRAAAAEWTCTTHPLMASSMDMMKLPLQFTIKIPVFFLLPKSPNIWICQPTLKHASLRESIHASLLCKSINFKSTVGFAVRV
jgi:hypothetical protein